MCLSGICLNIGLASGDEIWNFQNVYKMYNGFKIYEDANVIITPLFFICAEFIFHFLGANLFVFRISHCFQMAILFIFTYKLLKKLQIPKTISLFTVLMIDLQEFFLLIRISFNYNNMALLFFIMGVYYLINEKTRKNMIIQAVITIFIILTKQNIGIYYLIGCILYFLISNYSIKQFLKYIFLVMIGISIFIVYLLLNNNLYNFLNYTFGGILEFAKENVNFDVSGMIFMASMVMINIFISIFFIRKDYFLEKQKENIKILFIFSMVLCIVCYPIFNRAHILIGIYLTIINVLYIMYILFREFTNTICKIVGIINCLLIMIMVGFSIYNMYIWINNITSEWYQYSWKEPFFGGIIGQEEYEKNEKILNYIKENDKNVIVVSNRAALYMIPLKRSNGDFDLTFKGNFGIRGEDGIIEKVDKMENTQFLIFENEDKRIYQESTKLKQYIETTKKYVGNIEGFKIYE